MICKGGFTDEYGVYHKSDHHYDIPYWEILNEVDFEHKMSVQYYTQVSILLTTCICCDERVVRSMMR